MKNFLRPFVLTLLYCYCCDFTANANFVQEDQPGETSLRATQKLTQSIEGVPVSLASGIYGDTMRIYAYATSYLPLYYTSDNESIAKVITSATDTLLVLTGVGETTITITQPGDETYEAADPVTFSIKVVQKGIDITAFPVLMVYGSPPNQEELMQYYVANGFISRADSLDMRAFVYLDLNDLSHASEGIYPEKVVVHVMSLPENYYVASNIAATLTIERDESYMQIDTLIVNGVKYPAPNDWLSLQTPCIKGFAQQDTADITIQVSRSINEVSVIVDSVEVYLVNPNTLPSPGICNITTPKLTIGEHLLRIRISARTGINKISRDYNLHIDQPVDTTGLFIRRWPDVLTVINNPQYNGGLSFSEVYIEKHSKDEIISSWNYYYEPEGFIDPTAEYRATLYSIDEVSLEQKQIAVCPISFSLPGVSAIVYPTVVAPGGTIRIETTQPGHSPSQLIDIYNTMGMRILSVPLNESVNLVPMPAVSGHYVIKVVGKEFKVMVR